MSDTTILEKEIRQQPDVVARLLQQPTGRLVAQAIREANPRYVVIAARGSSDNAARYAQYLFGIHCGLPVSLATPSISTLYGHAPRYSEAVVIGISQSGKSPDVTQVLKDAADQGALTVSITNDPDSPLATATRYHINLDAGEEISLAASKTYTAQCVALAMIVAHLTESAEMIDNMARLPALLEAVLGLSSVLEARAERFRFMSRCVTIGRGYNYATAFEIALKLKELTYVIAEPYSSADFRHGPKAMIEENFPVIVVVPDGVVYEDVLALTREMHESGADLTVIGAAPDALRLAHLPLGLPPAVPEWLSPVIAVVPGQLLAMHTARVKGHAIDKPRGLTKVTVTR